MTATWSFRIRPADPKGSVGQIPSGHIGVALGERVEDARADLERTVAEVCASDPWLSANPVRLEWWGGQFAPGAVEESAPVTRLVSDAHAAVHGSRPGVHGVPYGSDQRLMLGLGGVPTVIYGPRDVRQAHAPDESVPVAELVDVTRTLIRLVASTCGTRSDG